jgi:hypothetical protein
MRAVIEISKRLSTTTRSGWRGRFDIAHQQLRIVVAHRADAGQDGAGPGPPAHGHRAAHPAR